jgi:hypothetical protein
LSSGLADEIHAVIQTCIKRVTAQSPDCGQDFSSLSSLCMKVGALNENRNRQFFILLAFSLPIKILGERLQQFRIKLRLFDDIGPKFFPTEYESVISFHSRVNSAIERSMEMLEGLVDSDEIAYEKVVSELLSINKNIFGLQDKVNFIDAIFSNLP